MNLSEELTYVGALLKTKLMSEQSVIEKLSEIVKREKDRPIIEMSSLLSKSILDYTVNRTACAQFHSRRVCDCGSRMCTYPDFVADHAYIVFMVAKATGHNEPLLPESHLQYRKENKVKLEKRKDDAKNRADQEYVKAMTSIKTRHQEALKKAEEMK